MAAYNGEKYIEEQVKSIFNQQFFGEIELDSLVIVDDKSSKSINKIYNRLKKIHSRVEIFSETENIGVIKTFEKAINIACDKNVDYIALADQDDFWYPDKIIKTIRRLNETNSSLAYTDVSVSNHNLNITAKSKWLYSKTPPLEDDCLIPMIIKNPVTGCTLVFTKSFALSALPFPEGIPMHDRWLACFAAAQQRVCYLNQSTMLYRQHENNAVGGMSFGVSGFLNRLKKDANGSLNTYLVNRLKKRVIILSNIENNRTQKELLEFYLSSRLTKILRSVWYYRFINKKAKKIGNVNLIIDLFFTIFTPAIDHDA